jgi:hypothetical protein
LEDVEGRGEAPSGDADHKSHHEGNEGSEGVLLIGLSSWKKEKKKSGGGS